MATRGDREFYAACYERETDVEGNEVWPEPYQVDGRWFGHFPREILQSGSLRQVLSEISMPSLTISNPGLESLLIEQIDAAEAYEPACDNAIETSGIEHAKRDAERAAHALCAIARRLHEHPPRTVVGMIIYARAMAGWAEAEHEGSGKAQGEEVTILGRSLADAVLRVGMAV